MTVITHFVRILLTICLSLLPSPNIFVDSRRLPVKIVLADDLGKRGIHLTALRLAYDADPVDDSWVDMH